MKLNELWKLYEADKRIQVFSQHTLKAYSLQLKILVSDLGDLEIGEITLQVLNWESCSNLVRMLSGVSCWGHSNDFFENSAEVEFVLVTNTLTDRFKPIIG